LLPERKQEIKEELIVGLDGSIAQPEEKLDEDAEAKEKEEERRNRTKTRVELPTRIRDSVYGQMVLCPQVVNLVFTAISMLDGLNCLCFVRLLSALIKLEVTFDKEAAFALKDLLNREFNNTPTAFVQSLLELVLNIEKLTDAMAIENKKRPIPTTAALPPAFAIRFVGVDYAEMGEMTVTGDMTFTVNGELFGMVQYSQQEEFVGIWEQKTGEFRFSVEGSTYTGKIEWGEKEKRLIGTYTDHTKQLRAFIYKCVTVNVLLAAEQTAAMDAETMKAVLAQQLEARKEEQAKEKEAKEKEAKEKEAKEKEAKEKDSKKRKRGKEREYY